MGVAGIDGFELMEAIRDEFGIDMSGFDNDRYFGEEPNFGSLLHFFKSLLSFRSPSRNIPRLEIRHLQIVVDQGQWFCPNEEAP